MKTTTEWMNLYIEEVGKKYDKNIKIVRKSSSRFMKFLNLFVRIFNKNFMSNYMTTIGSTIYVPDFFYEKSLYIDALNVIAHECIHVKQSKDAGAFRHMLKVMFPQCIALLAIPFVVLGVVFHSLILGLLLPLFFLLFLAPMPAPWRYLSEIEAYKVNAVFYKYVYGDHELLLRVNNKYVVDHLSGPDYYYTWPWREDLEQQIYSYGFLEEGDISPIYQDVIDFLTRHNLTKK